MIRRPPSPPPFPTRRSSDLQGLYWSFNIFDPSGSTLLNNVVLGIRKAQLLSGAAFSGWQFNGLNVGGTLVDRSEEHTSELQSRLHLVCRLLLEKKKQKRVGV